MPDIVEWCAGVAAVLAAVYGVVKAAGPVVASISEYFHKVNSTSLKPLEDRVEQLEIAVAPTNCDKRSISDRLDTVKYQTRVTNMNVTALANWLSDQYPESPPPVIHPLPDR